MLSLKYITSPNLIIFIYTTIRYIIVIVPSTSIHTYYNMYIISILLILRARIGVRESEMRARDTGVRVNG